MSSAFRSPLFRKLIAALIAISTIVALIGVLLTAIFYKEWSLLHLQNQIRGLAATLAEEIRAGGGSIPEVVEALDEIQAILPDTQGYLVNREGLIEFSYGTNVVGIGNNVDMTVVQRQLVSGGAGGRPIALISPADHKSREAFSVAPLSIEGREGYLLLLSGSYTRDVLVTDLFLYYGTVWTVLVTLLMLTIAFSLAVILLRMLTKRFNSVVQHATALAEGAYDSRIGDTKTDEIGTLARSFDSMADAVQRNLETISQRDEVRRQLIADVSHDLRGPVHLIRLGVDAVRKEAAGLRENILSGEILQTIDGNLNKLQQLLQELFELAKLEAKDTPLELLDFEVCDFAVELASRYSLLGASAGIAISADVPPENLYVAANPELLQRAIGNLVENALRHTASGGTVIIRVTQRAENLRIAVIDTGTGIPLDEQKMVFERYTQGASVEGRGGAGLGLSIVKKIIQSHGSEIHVESQLGVGTEFWFDLPRVTA